MTAIRTVLPLGVAALIAGLLIGYGGVTLVSSNGVQCGSAKELLTLL
jgi:hypothetical protein